MRHGLRVSLVLLVVSVAFGCAAPTTKRGALNDAMVEIEATKQKQVALELRAARQSRLLRVANPILESATSLCEDKKGRYAGMVFANKHAYPEEFRDVAVSAFGMGEPLQVTYVIPGSPAAAAGLMERDVLLAFNGKPAPTGASATETFVEQLTEALASAPGMQLLVLRDGEKATLDVETRETCKYPVALDDSSAVNAYADGKKIVITQGMMRFVESDQELALVIAHELAHNIMAHIDAKMTNYALGSILDILAAAYGVNTQGAFGNLSAQAYSQEFESEADYVGLYLMARAGIEINNAANFWRRMAAEHPASIKGNHSASHPATPARFVGIENTAEEIRAKNEAMLPLVPELKE